jgi:hypothetical protein
MAYSLRGVKKKKVRFIRAEIALPVYLKHCSSMDVDRVGVAGQGIRKYVIGESIGKRPKQRE